MPECKTILSWHGSIKLYKTLEVRWRSVEKIAERCQV